MPSETFEHGPDHSDGTVIIDNLPEEVLPKVRRALIRRSVKGYLKYGTMLTDAFPHAKEAMAQEVLDAMMYGFALGLDMSSPWMQQLQGMANSLLED